QVVLPGRGVDTRNPQAAHFTTAHAPVAISVPVGLHHRLIGSPKELAARAPLALGHIKNFLVTATCYRTTFNSHVSFLAFYTGLNAPQRSGSDKLRCATEFFRAPTLIRTSSNKGPDA